MGALRYKSFISYSHRDEAWAADLHKALETYKVPRRLVGTKGALGTIPGTLSPVFRDRDDLSSAADLSEKVQDALKDSESLVVVCSPDAAKSRWVNDEIRLFRSLGREDRIFCVIVGGDPQASDPEEACFPPALLESDNGKRFEPLAADARKWGDGKSLAKLKLVSAILGIRLDELRRREQQRKRRFQAFAVLFLIAIVALVVTAVVSRIAEKARQDYAEALVSQLVDVSAGLDKVVDLETLRAIGERLAAYLDTLDEKNLTNESRMQIGLVLRRLGEVSHSQGKPAEAMNAFVRSRNMLMELVGDAPGDLDALFELGQAEYWVGVIPHDKGEWDKAEIAVTKYMDVSKQLFEAEPDNAEWAMEMAYAASNLGTIESRRVPADHATEMEHMQSAMEYNKMAARLDPEDEYYQAELAVSHANLADAWLKTCNLGEALSNRMSNVEYAAGFFNHEPNNKRLKSRYAYSLAGLAGVQQLVGLESQALESLGQSVTLLEELARQDPSNLTFRWNLYRKSARIAALLGVGGRNDESWLLSAQVESELRKLLQEDQEVSMVNGTAFAVFLLQYSELAYRRNDRVMATKWLHEGIERLQDILREKPDNKQALHQLRVATFQYWMQNSHRLPSDQSLSKYLDVGGLEGALSCNDASVAARLALLQGDNRSASDYTEYLLGKGFYEPGFTRFCREQGLCQ